MKYLWLLVAIVLAFWVYSDAKKRGKSSGACFGWFLGTLLIFPLFFPLWLISRPDTQKKLKSMEPPKLCPYCGKYYEDDPYFCPHCNEKVKWK
jgi:hypothetical protein